MPISTTIILPGLAALCGFSLGVLWATLRIAAMIERVYGSAE